MTLMPKPMRVIDLTNIILIILLHLTVNLWKRKCISMEGVPGPIFSFVLYIWPSRVTGIIGSKHDLL